MEDRGIELRHARSSLRIFGTGMLALTAWMLTKPLLVGLLVTEEAESAAGAGPELPQELSALDPTLLVFLLLGMLVLAVLVVVLRFYIGFSARAEGLGGHKSGLYVALAFLFFAGQSLGLVQSVWLLVRFGGQAKSLPDAAASLLLELCSAVTTGQLAVTAVKVRRLRRNTQMAE